MTMSNPLHLMGFIGAAVLDTFIKKIIWRRNFGFKLLTINDIISKRS